MIYSPRRCLATVMFLIGLLSDPLISVAQQPTESQAAMSKSVDDKGVLNVGTKQSPPFAIKNSDGSWTGISIELWDHLADELDLEYEFHELTLPKMLSGLEEGQLDAAVAAISVTSDRHERVDFCHPHYSTGLGIAVSTRNHSSPWMLLTRVVSSRLVKIVVTMVLIVAVCGFLFWFFERSSNTAMFGGKKRQGLGMGIWWSTIVLLGHKGVIPVSTMGRLLAALAMFASLIILSILTGVITSVLTVQQLDAGITRSTDLYHVRVATVTSSTSVDYLRQRRIFFRGYETPRDAIEAVDAGNADAVVYDAALLKYLARDEFANRINVLPVLFNVQEYAIALPRNNDIRKRMNEQLLRYRESDAWDELVFRYLGD